MKRTQIQLPEPLYREIQRVAELEEWSVAEVIRRGAEHMVRAYPAIKQKTNWSLPIPVTGELKVTDPEALRDLVRADQDAGL